MEMSLWGTAPIVSCGQGVSIGGCLLPGSYSQKRTDGFRPSPARWDVPLNDRGGWISAGLLSVAKLEDRTFSNGHNLHASPQWMR